MAGIAELWQFVAQHWLSLFLATMTVLAVWLVYREWDQLKI